MIGDLFFFFFFSSRRRHTRCSRDWSSDVCSSDHTIRLMESVDTTRDLLAGVLETYLSQTSNRMNRVMKQLSIVATVALPLIVIAGIYGMRSEEHTSELQSRLHLVCRLLLEKKN